MVVGSVTNLPRTPAAARALFGERLPLVEHYARLLGTTAVEHGLVGPAEGMRLWDRHLLNCAAIAPAFDPGASVVDIGSGAGLPGIVLAIARDDLRLLLVEPLERRCTWLVRTVSELGLGNVEVHRGRAESLHRRLRVRHSTARAVAPLRVLAAWALPLLQAEGSLLAIKGVTAEAELTQDRAALQALGATSAQVETYGGELLAEPTRVVRVSVDSAPPVGPAHPGNRRRRVRQGSRHSTRKRHREP